MPYDKKKNKKKGPAAPKGKPAAGKKESSPTANGNGIPDGLSAEEELCLKLEQDMKIAAEARSVTGVCAIHPRAKDIKIDNFSITYYGAIMLQDTKLDLSSGNRYGLIGPNGCGKSAMFAAIAAKEIPIQDHIDVFNLTREMPASDKTALQCVMEVDEERNRLEALANSLADAQESEAQEQLMSIYERLDELDSSTAEAKAAGILRGLGFDHKMQLKQTKDYSGGWRMRIALARALFLKPHLLLLDEPTNHLDLDACVWLEEELKNYHSILVIISHSQDFLNGVCNRTIHMHQQKLINYGGNYDTFIKTRTEQEENQMKQFNWEQAKVAEYKDFIARFGHGSAKLARQAQSREKELKRMVDEGLTERPASDRTLSFQFFSCGTIPPPVIMVQNVSFRYTDTTPWIYKNLEFGIDLDTRLALVGPNGAGKSTLLKLLYGELSPTTGMVRTNAHVKIARYHQHLHELLDLDASPVEYMMSQFPELKERDEVRKIVGRYGVTGKMQMSPIRQLSDGQRCRVVFAWLAQQVPHLLFLDEPTNHLDIETIDSLAEAISNYEGGMVLVSHDFRLIDKVAEEIWICENEKCTKWNGTIDTYKAMLKKKVLADASRKTTQPKK